MTHIAPSRSLALRVVSVFSGIAGLDSGLEIGGHEVVEMCESWTPARRVLAAHYPGVDVHLDIRTYTPTVEYDLLAAGFPCTDLSHAGGRTGIFGPSSGLVEHVFRIATATDPEWILLENVPNLLGLHAGAGMDHVIGRLEGLGYRWAYRTVDTRFTGVPQRRWRVIILAAKTHDPAPRLLGEDVGEPEATTHEASGFYWTEGRTGLGLVGGAIPTLKGGSTLGLPSAPAIWFPNRDRGGRLVLPGVEDGEALQGLPRGWTRVAVVPMEPDMRWKLIGNAVPVGVGKWVGERLAQPPTPAEEAATAGCFGPPIMRGRKWPKAGTGLGGVGYECQVSTWPRHEPLITLDEIVKSPVPLSHRATKGFLSRVDESGRALPEDFLRDVEGHLRHGRPEPGSSWASSLGARRRIQAHKPSNTGPELALRRLLHQRGLRYRLQVRPSAELRQRIDIAFMKEKVAVDVRGCFWHRCPQHATSSTANAERWADKLTRNVERDHSTQRTLEDLGWTLIVVWEHDDPNAAADRIESIVRARREGANELRPQPTKAAG